MKKDPILIKFGKRLQKERLKRGLSQEKLSELAGLNRNSIGNIERAEKNVTLKSLHAIAKALKMRVGKLVEG